MSCIILSNEFVFYVSGKVNKHNVPIWGTDRPDKTREHQAHSPKVVLWCALTKNQLTGLCYIDSSTVTGFSYCNMLKNYFLPMVLNLRNNILSQKDGAAQHVMYIVYRTPCKNVTQLKRNISTAVRAISGEVLGNVWETLKERINTVIREYAGISRKYRLCKNLVVLKRTVKDLLGFEL